MTYKQAEPLQAKWIPTPSFDLLRQPQCRSKPTAHPLESSSKKPHFSRSLSTIGPTCTLPAGKHPRHPIPISPSPLDLSFIELCVASPMHAYWPLVPRTGCWTVISPDPQQPCGQGALIHAAMLQRGAQGGSEKTRDLHKVTELVSSRAGFETCLTPNSGVSYHVTQPQQGMQESSRALWALHNELLWQHFTKLKLIESQKDRESVMCSSLWVNSYPETKLYALAVQ